MKDFRIPPNFSEISIIFPLGNSCKLFGCVHKYFFQFEEFAFHDDSSFNLTYTYPQHVVPFTININIHS